MTPADLNRLSKLLDDALDLPMTARANWLAALDGDAAPLVPTLRKLLARSARVETADVLARGPLFTAPHPSDEAPVFQGGDSVGPYLLLRAIGHCSAWIRKSSEPSSP